METDVSEDDALEFIDDNWTPSREQLVFLIDCYPKMFEPLTGKEGIQASSLFELSLRVSIDVLRSRIIDSENDEISVIFYGTKTTKNSSGHDNVYMFLDLDFTDISRIKQLGSLTDEKFNEEIGSHSDVDAVSGQCLKSGLCTAMEVLQNSAQTAKSVLLFTSNPNPSKDCDQTRDQLLEQASRFQSSHIFLRVFLLPYGSNTPEIEFWRGMNQKAKALDDPDDFDDDVLMRLENLFDGVRKKLFLKHPLSRLKLTLFKDIEINVQIYALIRPASKTKTTKVDSRTNEEVVRATVFLSEETGALIEPSDLPFVRFHPKTVKSSANYPEVLMNKTEIKEIKKSCDPGMMILGFKSMQCLKPYQQLSAPYFVYPDEKNVSDTITTYLALHEGLLSTETFAVCAFSTSRSPEVRLGALIAQEETLDIDGQQMDPPGFQLILLPYMDDIRTPEESFPQPHPIENKEGVQVARMLIRGLMLPDDFTTTDICNPQLQRHFSMIEAKALGEEVPERLADEAKPDAELLESNLVNIEAFKYSIAAASCFSDAHSKRKRKTQSEDGNLKTPIPAAELLNLAEANDLKSLTVVQLRQCLRSEGLPVSGKKEDVIARIREHLLSSPNLTQSERNTKI